MRAGDDVEEAKVLERKRGRSLSCSM